ncbi:MAG: hypothetical protein A2504_06230 [Bdellovibrionales bacterium RIFOXYD12_FULL_39_22]|nr:MAG: hypothetical protein A2385_08550 [Bdellovibrionales bacterium RIFOXYB1_FULL_39_21]OFZ45247.1 MAG: hypothetical protein A2485_05985 [Bdellovibrionales bacterium RIFOXYC12_FULL_39_17]OFZ45563.1 MAG: hypothetical protein A2404_03130 [Bdellovibrionales bacterium RIFOXYC1_FULL_39_130]OFZ74503.1 MAG: hypothetical protein A2451_08770 [Bdellovibrionales bacterium RIFOXYC2_FULL_39_8]OFZ77424.1 MAG: hypothetical protein A2560_08720 [Bdellovibrionales bacterium RIFOXYD1_FULL_39_84]OFZ91553.1 MAG:
MESEDSTGKNKTDFAGYYPLFFTLIFVVLSFQYSFSTLESVLYDWRIVYDWGINFHNDIVLITLDDESDDFLGEKYPYTYASHERFVDRLAKDRPSIISYLVKLNEPKSAQENSDIDKFKEAVYAYKNHGGIFRFATFLEDNSEILPPQKLRDLGYSSATINSDKTIFSKDDVARRMALNISGESTLHIWIANTYRAIKGLPQLNENLIKGAYYDKEADAIYSLFRYHTSPLENKHRISRIPFHRVAVGNFPKGFFSNKIVLIGSSYFSSRADFMLTPFNTENKDVSQLTIHAEMIESLILEKTVQQLPQMLTNFLSLIIAVVLSIIISKVRPTRGLLITVGVTIGIFLTSTILFSVFGLWLYTVHILLTVVIVYYILIPFRAINEYQRRFAIQEETKLLRKVENLKQNFISLMSHDLKTPVAKIAGMADVLLQQHKNNHPELAKGLVGIIDSTKELNRFITSILDLTKVESHNLKLNLASKDINTVVESVVEELRFEAANKESTLLLKTSPLYPIQIDVVLMKRVISNLVENALKYSGRQAKIEIETWDDAEWVYVKVADSGPGISAEDLDLIFDKFYRVKNDANHSIKGSGLGLFLVKYFVELHGGTISVESKLGEGTAFKVKLKNV